MSVDVPAGVETLPEADTDPRRGPRPAAHGAAVQGVFNDTDIRLGLGQDRDATLYDYVLDYWREHVGDRDQEPYVVARPDADDLDWLHPPTDETRNWAIVLTSSRWKAGRGEDDNYSAFYQYDLMLREETEDGDLHKAPISLRVEIMPQKPDMVYQDGNPLPIPHGEGTRAICWTTWAEAGEEIETRMLDALDIAFGADRDQLTLARNEESRGIAKAEGHHRFAIGKKRQVIDTVEQSKQLISYGGESEIDAHQNRIREGMLEARVDADRWELLGFEDVDWSIELKVYQAANWHEIPPNEPGHHPKLEASFSGVSGNGALPHIDDWDEVMGVLRNIVSSHLDWAAVGRDDLVEDQYQPGPNAPDYTYQHPANRREQLRARYEEVATEVWREATKGHTEAVYDILRTVATEKGATYDMLEERVGLARSTIRYHVRRLSEAGVLDRVGNPVLVVFPSLEVLDQAEEILRQVYPDDAVEDMMERAEDRRERRENEDRDRDAPDGDQDDDQDDEPDQQRGTWRYFETLDLEVHQLANALERDYLDGDEVRIRVDRRDWLD